MKKNKEIITLAVFHNYNAPVDAADQFSNDIDLLGLDVQQSWKSIQYC